MCQFKIYTIISTLCICGGLLVSIPVFADGDPSELAASDIKDSLLPDEKTPAADETVATVTADGDFLLPTYLLPGETANVTRTTTTEKVVEVPAKKVAIQITQDPAEPALVSTPVVADAPAPVVQVQTTTTTSQTTKPIVDASDELEQLLRQTAPASEDEEEPTMRGTITPSKRLLIPLAPVPVVPMAEPVPPTREQFIVPNTYATQMTESIKAGDQMPFLMPHDIRITFYPRVSSFSGQALKWVRAFATAALQDPRLIVEIRASCAEANLQNARIALIKGTMQAAGLSRHQMVTVYTNRPVDTILLRAVPRPEKADTILTQRDKPMPKSLARVQKW